MAQNAVFDCARSPARPAGRDVGNSMIAEVRAGVKCLFAPLVLCDSARHGRRPPQVELPIPPRGKPHQMQQVKSQQEKRSDTRSVIEIALTEGGGEA
jgi:hypothetical protein